MIRLYNVGKSYARGSWALQEVTFQVRPGEFAFLTGPSGAGKSTLLRLIFREELPTSGQIILQGRNLDTLSERRIPFLRRSIGVVFQGFRLLQQRTILENVCLPLRVRGVPVREQRRLAREVLAALGLGDRLGTFPPRLSGGEQQRVAIARALVGEPVLLLADEPTGNLDPDLALEIMEIFRQINTRGTTVVVATHDRWLMEHFETARRICLHRGRLISAGGGEALPEPQAPGAGDPLEAATP